MANSVDPDQLASSEAKWSESTLFAKSGHSRTRVKFVSYLIQIDSSTELTDKQWKWSHLQNIQQ